MELRRAMAIFRVEKRLPVEELNTAFRELVKKYHPDKLRDHPEWAHERMAEINDAYETLLEWLKKPPEKKARPAQNDTENNTPKTQKPSSGKEKGDESRDDHFSRRSEPVPTHLMESFGPIFKMYLNGLGLYFQYGLEQSAYRTEGVRRFRYREAMRQMSKAREEIDKLTRQNIHPVIKSVSRFMRLELAEITLSLPAFPNATPAERWLDNRFAKARREFVSAVKEVFFPELVPVNLHGRSTASLYSCYAEFIVYLHVYQSGERHKAAILMCAVYDAFIALLQMRDNGIIAF